MQKKWAENNAIFVYLQPLQKTDTSNNNNYTLIRKKHDGRHVLELHTKCHKIGLNRIEKRSRGRQHSAK